MGWKYLKNLVIVATIIASCTFGYQDTNALLFLIKQDSLFSLGL